MQTASGPLYGVVGAKPPQLLTEKDREKALKLDDLYVDVGYPADEVRRRVRVGDMVVMRAPSLRLANGRMARQDHGRPRQRRRHARRRRRRFQGAMCRRRLILSPPRRRKSAPRAQGRRRSALQPDLAIVIDVTHGEGPGTGKWEAFPVDKVVVGHGPNIHPTLEKIAVETAKGKRRGLYAGNLHRRDRHRRFRNADRARRRADAASVHPAEVHAHHGGTAQPGYRAGNGPPHRAGD